MHWIIITRVSATLDIEALLISILQQYLIGILNKKRIFFKAINFKKNQFFAHLIT